MDLLVLQLLALSPKTVQFSQDELPRLERQEGVITLDSRFGDSSIRKSISSQVQSSLVSKDQGFIN
jgi:hypothetical protein